jgi:hypothetical protein
MTSYVVYQCSVCRRIKDIVANNTTAPINQCIITKGCSGILQPIADTSVLTPTPPVAGLTDWYPRGSQPVTTPIAPPESLVDMSTSQLGGLTIAIWMSPSEASLNPNISVNFSQQILSDISYTEYQFNIITSTTVISGKDANGVNLRFSQAAINNNQLVVLVNGVAVLPGTNANQYVATPNIITFNTAVTAGSVVAISVFNSNPITNVSLVFQANYSFLSSVTSGAWANIRYLDEIDPLTGVSKFGESGKYWYVFTCPNINELALNTTLLLNNVTTLNSSNIIVPDSVIGYANARFLMASPPFDNVDRYLNFYISCTDLNEVYLLQPQTSNVYTNLSLLSDTSAMVELYPPFQLIYNSNLNDSSFVTADTFSYTDSVNVDTTITPIIGTIVIGPT